MEAILPFKIKNEQKYFESALKIGYNEMEIYKFIYVMQQSDLDIFPRMQDERINMLIYGWELCEDYKQKLDPNEWELPEEMEIILKLLVPWSLDIWFSKEWDKCHYHLKNALIHCLNRARDLMMRLPDMMQINWDFLLLYNLKPWNVLYLKNLTVIKAKTLENGAQSIETEELPATSEDISYVNLEQLPVIVLRLVKLFDQSSIDMVKTLSMRVLAAWNKIHQTELETSGSRRRYIPPEDKRCLLLICHIYLMAVYEADDVKGYVIDNMINNIRFYYQGFQDSTAIYAMDNLEYTPARFIALTNIHLRVQKRDFFDFFIWNKYDTSLVNLFGVVSQAYKSYLLGNLLMELNNMNEDDFASNIPLYKRLMNSYVNEREKSEQFLLNELEKLEAQRFAHNIIQTVQNITDFKSKICKGNRMSNIGNYENSDDTVTPFVEPTEEIKEELKEPEIKQEILDDEDDYELKDVLKKESELRLDPIFQNLPNNKSILYYVYEVLAKKDYNGWHFAKIVLLVKIIDHELNMIETWRYHPGLTTDFMLNLEVKMSQHYVDLAKIFRDHAFLEQEFWLTAFYLNPTTDLYENIKRLGMRNNRKRTDEHTKLVMSKDNIDAKFGLLSSTIDVKEIVALANTEDPDTDYNPLYSALHTLRIPDSLVKDMITAIFLPRNKSFAWVIDWSILRARCKLIMTNKKEKKRFVELNMAEANDRLKYLIIDYEKYKNRPQLDYGTIEEGYENLMTIGDFDKESEEEEEEEDEEDDFEDDEDVYDSKRRGRGSFAANRKKEEEKNEDENSQEDDPFLMGKRRTRARTAATLASFLFQTLPRASRRKRNQEPQEEPKVDEDKTSADNDDKSSDSKSPVTTSESPMLTSPPAQAEDSKDSEPINIPTKNIKECLSERPSFLNSTQGFQNLIDIWNVEATDLQTIDENCVSLMESSAVLQRAVKWKQLNKEINPQGCDEEEFINDQDLLIHNAEFAVKMEYNSQAVKEEEPIEILDREEMRMMVTSTPMEVDGEEAEVSKEDLRSKETLESITLINEEKDETEKTLKQSSAEKSETEQIQETPPPEDNSSESINSDMSTAADRDSGEASESNTAMNSKRNSINNDNEVELSKIIEIVDEVETQPTTAEQNEKTDSERNKEEASEEIKDVTEKDQKEETEIANKNETSTDNSETNEKDIVIEETKTKTGTLTEEPEIDQKDNKDSLEKKDDEEALTDKTNIGDLTDECKVNEKENEISTENKDEKVEILSDKDESVEKPKENKDKELKETTNSKDKNDKNKDSTKEEGASKVLTMELESKETENDTAIDSSNSEDKTESPQEIREKSIEKQQTLGEKLTNDDEKKKVEEANELEDTKKTSPEEIIIKDRTENEAKSKELDKEEQKTKAVTKKLDKEKLKNKNKTEKLDKDEEKSEKEKEIERSKEIEAPKVTKDTDKTDSEKEPEAKDSETVSEEDKEDKNDSTNNENIVLHYSSSEETEAENAKKESEHTSNDKTKNDLKSGDKTKTEIKAKTKNDQKSTEKTETEIKAKTKNDLKSNDKTETEIKATEKDSTKTSSKLEDSKIDKTDSVKIEERQLSTDSETRNLKEMCMTKKLKVLVRKLRPSDLTTLRQPKVKIRRVNYDKYMEEFRAKRRRIEGKEMDESSNSYGATSSSSEAYQPNKVKRKIPLRRQFSRHLRTSESDNDSNNSDDLKLSAIKTKRKITERRLSTPSSSQSSNYGPSSSTRTRSTRQMSGPKSKKPAAQPKTPVGPKSSKHNLVVTPRSASGLKLRISNAEQGTSRLRNKKISSSLVYDEVIQLSSSSSDACILNAIEEEVIEIDDNPLFEEEIII